MTSRAGAAATVAGSTRASPTLVILGIDPGLTCTGYGVLSCTARDVQVLDLGTIRTDSSHGLAARLLKIHQEVGAILRRFGPGCCAVEEPFVNVNPRTSLRLGEARAASLLAIAGYGLEPAVYSPAEVKQAVTGYGRGEKAQVQEMLRLQLGLAKPPQPADAADALAVALCHWTHLRLPG